jgi:glycosyltransferase involved in cell wall biosynthesis
MRILIGTPQQNAQGGPAACEPPFNRELLRLGAEVDEEVYTFTAPSGLFSRTRRVVRTASRFRKRAAAGDYDVIHLNTSFDTMALFRDDTVVRRLSKTRAKLFLKFHGSDARLLETRNPILRTMANYLLSRADGIGVLSSEERTNFLRAGVPERKVFQVKNVVEPIVAARNFEFAQQLKVPVETPLLLFIGRFIPAKGLLDCINACKLIADRGEQLMLLCVGDGPARMEAEATVARLGLKSTVRFFGYISEAAAAGFYANSTMLVFPTYHYEGFPMVIFNAAARGLPIITTRIRAAADFLREPDNCLWVEPQRPDLLAERITALLHDAELRKAMGTNNQKLAAQFSAEIVTREYVEIYRLLEAGG